MAEKIRCGSLLLDLEATVDSSLVRTASGEITGRRPGLSLILAVALVVAASLVAVLPLRRPGRSPPSGESPG